MRTTLSSLFVLSSFILLLSFTTLVAGEDGQYVSWDQLLWEEKLEHNPIKYAKEMKSFMKELHRKGIQSAEWYDNHESGFLYQPITAPTGTIKPNDGLRVWLDYKIYTFDGVEIYNSNPSGGPPKLMNIKQLVFPGYITSVLSMKKGEHTKFLIPYRYTFKGERRGPILPYASVIFEVKLHGISLLDPIEGFETLEEKRARKEQERIAKEEASRAPLDGIDEL
eukprot:TRINITY_DN10143_c0_g1_i1.p1 TRINITY_DN10143_c0_g1~~TRINITY_DN10143_c0_g1_i1.p1  ORF type:complete len:232 (-),score=64.75 TRINITY_DN10143_c0_g1_i1:151-819(-)